MNHPSVTVQDHFSAPCEQTPRDGVGQDLSDAQRETRIRAVGQLMESAYARYEASNCIADAAEAHRYRLEMEGLIRGRSAGQVVRMEVARGLA